MVKTIFKCVMCEGNVYPCIFYAKTKDKSLNTPMRCPYDHKKVRWEKVSKESEPISYDADGNVKEVSG